MTRQRHAISLPAMLAAGVVAVRRYAGLAIVLYLVQLAVSTAVGWQATRAMASALAELPVFDRAVAGDLPALIHVLREYPHVFLSVLWAALTAIAAYMVISWYLIGGLNAVLIEQPQSRAETAQCFGAGGAATFLSYLRLALVSLIPYAVAVVALFVGFYLAADSFEYALSDSDVVSALIRAMLPAAILWWIVQTAVDYARIKLSRGEGGSAILALLAGFRLVFSNWRPLMHVLLYAALWIGVSLALVAATRGSLITGALGLLAVRQLVSMIRFAGKLICAGGQVELGMSM